MAGHSKWANIQHRKNRQDARKAKVFTKLVREITVAARLGGADPDANPRLRAAITAAKNVSMPSDNIQRAIDKGTGAGGADQLEEVVYEGYGPGGVAFFIEAVTDNRNRTASEMRNLFNKTGGALAESGAVAWQFKRRSLVTVPREAVGEVRLTELLLEVGAEDFSDAGDVWAILAADTDLHAVTAGLEAAGVEVRSSEWIMEPTSEVPVDERTARQVAAMSERLDDHDDVQKVWVNADLEAFDLEAASV